ncbi:MAG TPA: hypothetical protein C5S51_06425 [Methanosarcinaceae archaeon]|nr:hypothetical protein [Methanosarcinaceae archaeon]
MDIDAVQKSFKWIKTQQPDSAKKLSRIVSACALWDIPNNDDTACLIRMKQEGAWNDSVRETARACSALAVIGIMFNDSKRWLLSRQHDGSWNEDVYDTTYSLAALADMGESNENGCRWVVENYSADWEHVGTTALIITALWKQDKLSDSAVYRDFINERAEWILSERETDGGWKFISTSNIVMQALMLVGFKDELDVPVQWLLREMNDNGSWGKGDGDVTATALGLITIGMWMSEVKRVDTPKLT